MRGFSRERQQQHYLIQFRATPYALCGPKAAHPAILAGGSPNKLRHAFQSVISSVGRCLVPGAIRGSDASPSESLAAHQDGPERLDRGADWFWQNARRL